MSDAFCYFPTPVCPTCGMQMQLIRWPQDTALEWHCYCCERRPGEPPYSFTTDSYTTEDV